MMDAPILLPFQNLPFSPKQSPTHDSNHWNSIIKRQAKLKNDNAILTTYTHMEALGVLPDSKALPLIFKACANLRAVERGKRIHFDIVNADVINDVRVGTSLVDFYCKCGYFQVAIDVFDDMQHRDLVAWNAMISGCVECLEYEEALVFTMEMQKENLRPNSRTVVSLLLACGQLSEVALGKEVHGYCFRNEILDINSHVSSALIGFYSKFDVSIAYCVFQLLHSRSIVDWNAMITGYFESSDYVKVLELFLVILEKGIGYDDVTILVVILACAELGCFDLGMQVHQLVIKNNFCGHIRLLTALFDMYNAMGDSDSSFDLFASVSKKDVVLWNSMISSYVDCGFREEAINMFRQIQVEGIRLNEKTIVIMLNLLATLENGLRSGRSLHAYVIKCGMGSNSCSLNALISMYGKLYCTEDALKIFSETADSNIVSWNTVISALAHNQLKGHVAVFFRKMKEFNVDPNSHSIISILAACDDESFLIAGRSIHAYAIKSGFIMDAPLNTAVTEMYMTCGDEVTAKYLFESFSNKDLISWNAMIANYVSNNRAQEAISLLHCMVLEVEPNSSTITNALSACTHLASLPQGLSLHAYTIRRESLLGFPLSVANALITMYSRCGSMQYAEKVFKALPKRNSVSWNAIIAGYGMHGRGQDALIAFSQMLEDGLMPSEITFVSLLSACSHSGLIEKGLQLYHSMVQNFYINPKLVHYACVVDLLSRGGRLDEAMEFIKSMPIAPDVSVWRSLLGACRVYSETRYVKIIFEKLVELEPTNAGNYILLSNVYAATGQWSKVKKLRLLLEKNGLVKPPGKSWIVVRNELHHFTAGDRSHPQCDKIYEKLSLLLSSVRETGYVPDLSWVLHDEDDQEKERRLFSHSEKLAIAFGLISTGGRAPILITKNLRVCGDCHEFSKHVSKLVGREIVLRDGSRFHHFIGGLCSCKDYW